MYYLGTEAECNTYNKDVTTKEGYNGATSKWAEVTKHCSKEEFAILANPKYSSELKSIKELPSDWFKK